MFSLEFALLAAVNGCLSSLLDETVLLFSTILAFLDDIEFSFDDILVE